MMKEYNAPFFSLYENLYKTIKEEYEEKQALYLFRKIMETGLKKAYDTFGFKKGDPNNFAATLKPEIKQWGF